jgi:hypothetical protein
LNEIVINKSKIDTMLIRKIYECLEPVSHPGFIGYCCCDDKCNGYQEDYYDNGKLRMDGNFKDGIPYGEVKTYHRSGKVKEIISYNKKGKLRRTILYNENGTIISNN